jgi:hypothetical protein
MKKSTQTRGAQSELIACAWLLSQGYHVFRNVSPCGPADLIVVSATEIIYIDVKTSDGKAFGRLTPSQVKCGVAALYVCPDGTCVLDRFPAAQNGHAGYAVANVVRAHNQSKLAAS